MSASVYRIGSDVQLKTLVELCQDSPGERVILVVPTASSALMSTANLRLLAAYAGDYGKKLVLVTGDKALQELGRRAGVEVYADLQQAELACYDEEEGSREIRLAACSKPGSKPEAEAEAASNRAADVEPEANPLFEQAMKLESNLVEEKSSTVTTPDKKSGWTVRVAILCVALLASVAIYYMVTPKVVLTIQPAVESVSFHASQLLSPGELISLVHDLSGSVTVPSTGSRIVGDRPSTGEVTIFNLGLEPVRIPQGTQISSLGKSRQVFVTTREVNVPVGSVVAGKVVNAGRAEVPVKAITPGSQGNLAKNTEFQFLGPYSEFPLVVSNAMDFVGGTDRLISIVTQSDVDAAKSRLRQELMAKAEREWYDKAAARAGIVVPEQRLQIVEQYAVNVKPGDAADTVTAQGTFAVSGWLIDSELLWAVVKDSMVQVQLPGHRLQEDSLHIKSVKLRSAAGSDDAMELIADVAVSRVAELDKDLKDNLTGVAVGELSERLVAMGASPQYSLYPEEIDRLPRWSAWIKVTVSGDDN